MKKSVGVVGVVLAGAVAYGISSWYVGQRAQDSIETAVVEGNARLGKVLGEELSTQPVKLSISRYDRGWFSSNIIYSLKFSGSGGEVTEFLLAELARLPRHQPRLGKAGSSAVAFGNPGSAPPD